MSFEDQLVASGGSIEIPFAEHGQGYGSDGKYQFMWREDRVYVGLDLSFDRWANSRDFVLFRPIDKVDLQTLRNACDAAIEVGHFDDGWALEYDVGGYYRKVSK